MNTDLGTSQEARTALEHQLTKDIAVDFDALFPQLTGPGVEKKNRKRVELLNNVAPVLEAALHADETVQFVTHGAVNLLLEQALLGPLAPFINGTTVVCTNLRLLLVHTSKGLPKSYINQVARDAVEKTWFTRNGSLFIKLGSGSVVIGDVPWADKPILVQQLHARAGGKEGKELLCPKCYAAYKTHTIECPQCGATFKSPAVAARRSALIPGLGDFYLGYPVLALLEMCGALAVWLSAVREVVKNADALRTLIIALGIILVTHGVDAALTYANGKKGLTALDDELATGPKTAAPARQPQAHVPVPITPR